MRNYEVVTPLAREPGKKPVQPGKVVELDQAEGEPLVAIGALRHAPTPKAAPKDKPLLEQPLAELKKIAKREKVELPDDVDVAGAAALIQAARDGAADEGGSDGADAA